MKQQNKINRRRFLAAAGAAVAGTGAVSTLTPSASTQGVLKIRKQAAIPYKPDVLVVGGGPAGIGAALGAAGYGAKTLLIENHGFFGGVAAWCLGMPINQMRPGGKPRSEIHELVLEKLRAYGDQAVRVGQHQLWCNVDYLKVAVLDALDQV
ncbi:MAG: FAD-dependent oxidoreductase, partial [Candidatus Zixiibacteriota bacterium]